MALNFQSGGSAAKKPASPAAAAPKKKAPSNGVGFIAYGKAAKVLQAEAAAKAEAMQAEAGKLWRFRINEDDPEDHRITFVDGTLDEEGTLEAPMWHEHTIQLGGKWKNIPCTSHEEPCPMCANGDNVALVAGFTVIDHTPYKIQNGPNAGKTVENSKKLLVAKRTSYALLQKLAGKHGGLAGTTWDASRSGDKSPNVGNLFQFVDKNSLSDLKKEFGELAEPADFAEEITYFSREQLIEQGVKATGKVVSSNSGKNKGEDLDGELGG
jgi:hypothetical protein